MKKFTALLFLLTPVLFSCAKSEYTGSSKNSDPCYVNGVDTCNAVKPLIIVNLNSEKQTIDNFGASDCWTTKFIGKWGNAQKKNQIADYLFSMDTTSNGSPKGIGLSLWRFNIGAGSFEQGDSSGIASDFRREECFLSPNGTYDWTKQAGQQWFLSAAKARGLNNFLGFSISPPVQFTISGKAYGLGTTQLNLKASDRANFADFMVNVVQHFNQNGFNMRYLSPINEPQYTWGDKAPSQEGTGATNKDIADLVKVLGQNFRRQILPQKLLWEKPDNGNF